MSRTIRNSCLMSKRQVDIKLVKPKHVVSDVDVINQDLSCTKSQRV